MGQSWNWINRFFRWHRNDSKTLKSLIEDEMPSVHNLPDFYWPSFKSAFLLVLFSIILIIPSHFLIGTLPGLNSQQYQNLIEIDEAMVGIIFALIIFIAQFAGDQHESRVSFRVSYLDARVLFKVSYLYPLLVLTVLSFFNFLWSDMNILAIIPLIVIGILSLYSASKIIAILFNRYQFFYEYFDLLKDRLEISIKLAIEERIGNNILLDNLEEIKLRYHPFPLPDKSKYHKFYSTKKGIISDINLVKLKEFAEYVDWEARKKGYGFNKDEIKNVSINDNIKDKISVGKHETYNINRNRFLLKKYKDRVDEASILICIDKTIISDARLIDKLKKLITEIFIIEDKDVNFSEEIRLELSEIKDQLIVAIKDGNLGKIEDSYKVYTRLKEAFSELLTKYGGKYTFQQAQRERCIFFSEWNDIKWLSKDIKEVFHVGMESKDPDIIKAIGFLPVLMAQKAIELEDHYFFQEFIDIVVGMYRASQRESEPEFKSLMVDRSWRYLKETSEIIELKLNEKGLAEEDLKSIKDFAIYIFIVFQELLIEAKENLDLESFQKFNDCSKQLFNQFKPSKEDNTSRDLQHKIGNLNQYELEDSRKDLKILEEIEREIKDRKGQMFFGLAAYVFENYKKDKHSEDKKRLFLEVESSLPEDLKEFTEIFLSTHSIADDNFWGCMQWKDYTESRKIIVDTEKLEGYYIIGALRSLKNLNETEIEQIELLYENKDYNRDLAFLASDKFIESLDEIESNPKEWSFILNREHILSINSLKKLLQKSAKILMDKEREIVRKKRISEHKVEEFKEDVLEGFNKYNNLDNIFNQFDLYENQTNKIKEDIIRFGINRIDDKAIFFDKWHLNYFKWGINYGREMAVQKNSRILKNIQDQCEPIPKKGIEKKFEKFDDLDEVIILISGIKPYRFIKKSDQFLSRGYECLKPDLDQLIEFIGCYMFKSFSIPIFKVYGREKDRLFIFDKTKLGRLIQYSPLDEGEDESLLKDKFYINIKSYSKPEEFMEDLSGASVDWLENIGDEEDKIQYLDGKVWIQIFERFEYKKEEEFKGYFVKFT